jgi:hypothetical protein
MGENYYYYAFGLRIRSDLEFAELTPTDAGPADLEIHLGPTGYAKPQDLEDTVFEFHEDKIFMCWPIVGGFLLTGTSRIDIEPTPGIDPAWIAFPLLGPVISILLHKRGSLIMHASAIAIGNKSAIFAGDKMAGKSTTAAAFIRAGHELLTDDVLSVEFGPDGPWISPGFPQLKLAEDAENAMALSNAERSPVLHPGFEKRQSRLTSGFSNEKIQPTRVYVLQRGTKAEITPLEPVEALKAVIQFSYIIRFQSHRMGAEPGHLANCAKFTNLVQVCRLEVPTGLHLIDQAVRLVESDLS